MIVFVGFQEDERTTRFTGDGGLDWDYIEYTIDLDKQQLCDRMLASIQNSWGESDLTTEEFKEEYSVAVTGGWVIEEEHLKKITENDFDPGCDSASYAMNNAIKMIIDSFAITTV